MLCTTCNYTAAVGHEVPVVFVIICREAGTYPCSIRVNLEPSQGVDTTVPFNKVTGRESNLKHYSLGFKTFSQNLSIFTIVKFSMAFKGHSSDLVTITLWLWQQFDRLETKFLAFSNSFNCWFRHSNGWYCCWNSWRFRLNGSCCCSNDWYLRSNGSCCCTNRFQWSYEWIPMVIQTVCWKSKRFMQSFEWYV